MHVNLTAWQSYQNKISGLEKLAITLLGPDTVFRSTLFILSLIVLTTEDRCYYHPHSMSEEMN